MRVTDILTEAPFRREPSGLGFEVLYGQNVALAGGGRSGGAPAGLLRAAYQVLDFNAIQAGVSQNDADLGVVEIYKDAQDQIRGLINIKLVKAKRKAGVGSEIIQGLIDTCPGPFSVWDIQRSAVGFWAKMGCLFYNVAGKQIDAKNYRGGLIAGIIWKGEPGNPLELPGFNRSRLG